MKARQRTRSLLLPSAHGGRFAKVIPRDDDGESAPLATVMPYSDKRKTGDIGAQWRGFRATCFPRYALPMKNSRGREQDRNEAERNSGAHAYDSGHHEERERDRRFRPGKVEILQVNEATDYGSSDEEERQQRNPSDQERRQPDTDDECEMVDPDDRVSKTGERSLPERAWAVRRPMT